MSGSWLIQHKDNEALFLYFDIDGEPRWEPYGKASALGDDAPLARQYGHMGKLVTRAAAYRRLIKLGVIAPRSPTPETNRRLGTWGRLTARSV